MFKIKGVFKFYRQYDQMDCGPACLKMIARFYDKNFHIETLRNMMGVSREGVDLNVFNDTANKLGFRSLIVETNLDEIEENAPLPAVLLWDKNHLVVLYKVTKKRRFISVDAAKGNASNTDSKYYIADPKVGRRILSRKEIEERWLINDQTRGEAEKKGIAILLEPTEDLAKDHPETPVNDKKAFRNIINYLKHFKKLILRLFFFLILTMLIQLILPILTKSVVDIGIGNRDLGFINLILIAQVTLFLSKTFLEFARSWLLMHITLRINISVLSDFFKKLLLLPINFFETRKTGDILQRMNDHDRIDRFISVHVLNTIFSFFSVITFSMLLSVYSIKIFLLFVVSCSIYMVWALSFMRKRKILDSDNFNLRAKNQNVVLQLLNGIYEIKLNNNQNEKRWEWERLQIQQYDLNVRGISLSQAQQTGSVFINEGKNILITFLAASSVVNGHITLGTMIAIQYIMGQLNAPIELLIQFIMNYQDAKLSFDRINDIHLLNNEDDGTFKHTNSKILNDGDIVLKDVNFSYTNSDRKVLKDINITFPRGKVTAIVGMSGGGKTTLIKLLMRFYNVSEGRISIGDKDILGINLDQWREECGAVLQNGFIFSDTIAANINLGKEEIDLDKLEYATKTANISEFISELPLRYETVIGPDGIDLSQGQRQRILIARAIYKNPSILFFDEATNALDTTNEMVIMNNLNRIFSGKTVIIIAHRLSTVRNADQIIVMDNGRVTESGDHQSLINMKSKYYNLIKDQL